MAATLYLCPTTNTALAHIVEHVRIVRRDQPLAALTFLLPSGDAIRQLRHVLGDVVAVRFLQFYNLSAGVLGESGSATHEMSDLATRRLVRAILAEMNDRGELTTFAPVLDKPGFIDVLVEWLREMKTQEITDEAVAKYAWTTGKPRDLQLAGLYRRYQSALASGDCADADGLLWLAADALERVPSLMAGFGELVVVGFDQFSPVQLRIVKALAARVPLNVYLLWDGDRPANSLALGRLAPTHDALLSALSPVEISLEGVATCGPALTHIRQSLFEAGRAPSPDPACCASAIAAPSPEAEVRQALRRIKRLLLDGVREEDIALVAPQPGTYRAIVAAVSREYGVPVACETTLGENPCVAALANLLELAPDFPWRQTFDALRSPYVLQEWLDEGQVKLLDALTRERPVISGQDQWWYALERAPDGDNGEDVVSDDDDGGEAPLVDQCAADEIATLKAGLAGFFSQLTPPAEATHAAYVAWIQDALLGVSYEQDEDEEAGPRAPASLRIVEAAEQGDWALRDVRALRALLQALRTWLDAVALAGKLQVVPGTGQAPRAAAPAVTWGEFAGELMEWLPSVPVPPDRSRAAVRFGPLEINRAVTVDHLFILGLGEGEFPRPPQPDPLYTPAERASHPLPLVRLGNAEDASLWWQVLSNCQCSVTLLRSRYDANGAAWQPSAYWTAVVDLVDGLRVEQPRLAAPPDVEEAACGSELIEALALGNAPGMPAELAGLYQAVLAASEVAGLRDGWAAPGQYEGVLRGGAVAADLRRRFGPGRTWSLSKLNRYGTCPYAFWAQQALELEPLADPAEGFDAMQRGSLVHKILEKLFVRLAEAGMAPGAGTVEEVQALLEAACDELLPGAAARYGFRPGPLWEHEQAELRAELRAYVDWECEPRQAGPFRPFRQELKFGLGPGTGLPVAIPGFEGQEIFLRGVIDRIDSDGAGHLRVIDYKTGSKPFRDDDIVAGRALQSALYAWAVEELMPDAGVVVESCYRHTGSRKESGAVRSSRARENEMVMRAAAKAVEMAGAAAKGWFPAAPSKPSAARACDEMCDFLGLCRVTRHGARKARSSGSPLSDDPPATAAGRTLPAPRGASGAGGGDQ